MLSKNEIKFIRSLAQSKYREMNGCFIAEGSKVIHEFLSEGFEAESIYVTGDISGYRLNEVVVEVSPAELKKISQLVQPQDALAVLKVPDQTMPSTDQLQKTLILACDNIRDPGNLGTIIRIADWFDIRRIICSVGTVEGFNPKVVQASMGSLARVSLSYGDLLEFLEELKTSGSEIPVMITTLNGRDIRETELPSHGILVMGNEAAGVDKRLAELADLKLKIPSFGRAESLNVAVATGIMCAALRRAV